MRVALAARRLLLNHEETSLVRPSSPMSLHVCARLALILGLIGCGSADEGVRSGGQDAGGDGYAAFGDSGPSCDNSLDRAGCPCAAGSAPRSCYAGRPTEAGVGSCTMGEQSCVDQTESGGTWGPCTGSGGPTTCTSSNTRCGMVPDGCGGQLDCGSCGTDACQPETCASLGDDCGSVSDGCGGMLECGVCAAGRTCGGGGNPGHCGASDSCRNLALTYGSIRFPATVCLLSPSGTLECAVNPADMVPGSPLLPSSTLSDLACISGGEDFICAVTSAGGVVCWGDETAFDPAHVGTVPLNGNATVVNETLAIPGLQPVVSVAAGETHVCVLTANQSVMCWGNPWGEINTGNWGLPAFPTTFDIGGPAMDIASGDGFSCALRQDGVVRCWGNNDHGELGDGTTTTSATPVTVTGLPTRAVGVWADQATYPCALLQDGSVWCWGGGSAPPQRVTGFSGPVTALTVGGEGDASCALMATGGVQCWSRGQPPIDELAAGSGVAELRSIDFDYCGLLSSGSVTCWYTTSDFPSTPATVPGL
jgi:alpha-tubulin suppressor-like RCC1 family protein